MCSLMLLSIGVITQNIDYTGMKLEYIMNPVFCCISNKCHLYTIAYNTQHCLCLTKLRHFLFSFAAHVKENIIFKAICYVLVRDNGV